jgi:hypothetical protein
VQEIQQTPEQIRERLRQEELRRNPTGSVNDAFNRASSGGLADLVGS